MNYVPIYPQQNSHRTSSDLSGYWRFKADPDDKGISESWFNKPLTDTTIISVPGAWNEQLAERGLMNYVGGVWYETDLQLTPLLTEGRRVFIRFGAVDHKAEIWLNGKHLAVNVGGYLPFEVELTDAWITGASNRLTVFVDSRLSMTTLPQSVNPKAEPYSHSSFDRRHTFPSGRFDFFPYGGITRAVNLQTMPKQRIVEVNIDAFNNGDIDVHVQLEVNESTSIQVIVTDSKNQQIAERSVGIVNGKAVLQLHIENPELWSPASPTLYFIHVNQTENGKVVDSVSDSFGFREIRTDGAQILLNGEPLFLTGFGKHEDYPILGHGQFRSAYLRDFELLRWIGANSFRTSHYPYDEEIMRLADELGFMVINEVPAVSLGFESDDWNVLQPLLKTHTDFLGRLIARDRNRPSVISWSIVNEAHLWSEPNYKNKTTERYFTALYDCVKAIDTSRPVISITCAVHDEDDPALVATDIIGLNRYYAWYDKPAELDEAAIKLDNVLERHWDRYKKPIIMTEYGADTIDGYHSTFPQLFTEEYQEVFLDAYSTVLESKPYVAGTHVWNFADFRTGQHHRRVVHNRKGVFTRSREPKRAAFALRQRWTDLDRVAINHRPNQLFDSYLVPDIKKPK